MKKEDERMQLDINRLVVLNKCDELFDTIPHVNGVASREDMEKLSQQLAQEKSRRAIDAQLSQELASNKIVMEML